MSTIVFHVRSGFCITLTVHGMYVNYRTDPTCPYICVVCRRTVYLYCVLHRPMRKPAQGPFCWYPLRDTAIDRYFCIFDATDMTLVLILDLPHNKTINTTKCIRIMCASLLPRFWNWLVKDTGRIEACHDLGVWYGSGLAPPQLTRGRGNVVSSPSGVQGSPLQLSCFHCSVRGKQKHLFFMNLSWHRIKSFIKKWLWWKIHVMVQVMREISL